MAYPYPRARIQRLPATAAVGELLLRHRIYTSSRDRERPRPLGPIPLTFYDDTEIEPYVGLFKGHSLPRRMGAFSYSNSDLSPFISMGRYCSVAPDVEVMGSGHPITRLSTSPFSYGSINVHPNLSAARDELGDGANHERRMIKTVDERIIIEHDVWIGQQVLLARGVRIGTGSIIAARAVVTKDVPPYTIVGGVPAKVLKPRFADQLAEALLASEWWRYAFTDFGNLDTTDPVRCLEQLAEMKDTLAPYSPAVFRPAEHVEAS